MVQKITIKKREEREKQKAKKNLFFQSLYEMKGKEKIEYDISLLKSNIKSIEYDLSSGMFGDALCIKNKLNQIKVNLRDKEKQLKEWVEA